MKNEFLIPGEEVTNIHAENDLGVAREFGGKVSPQRGENVVSWAALANDLQNMRSENRIQHGVTYLAVESCVVVYIDNA